MGTYNRAEKKPDANAFDRVKTKETAKSKIKNNIFNLFVANLIVLVIMGPINGIPGFGQIIAILLSVVQIGLSVFYLNYLDKKQIDYVDIFYSFKVKDINTYLIHLGTILVKYLLIFLWMLLFIIPGIIKAIAYSQVNYIRAENPDLDIMGCLKESEEMMYGHKMEYFLLQLSFIGWFFLVVITFGILSIYVMPYYSMVMAMYYRNLRPLLSEDKEAQPLKTEPFIS